MNKLNGLLAAGALVLAGVCAPAAQAAPELVVNGGFESGDFSGWTESGAIGSVYGVDTAGPRNGNYSAYFGASDPAAFISQTLATTAGERYLVSFYLDRSPATGAGSFSASLNGVQFYAAPGNTFPFAQISISVFATGANSVLTFAANNALDFYTLDSVSVTAVPEPAAAALLLMGLAGLAASRKRQPH